MPQFLCQFQQVDVNSSPGYENLTLNCWFLPFKPNTFTTLVDTKSKVTIIKIKVILIATKIMTLLIPKTMWS
jgi:hypothetical protein